MIRSYLVDLSSFFSLFLFLLEERKFFSSLSFFWGFIEKRPNETYRTWIGRI